MSRRTRQNVPSFSPGPQPRRLISTLRRGQVNAVLGVLSDSTGVPQDFTGNQRWVYLLGQWLGQQFPAYTVIFKQWNDTNQSYDADRTIQTGTGSLTFTIYNGAVTGTSYNYILTGTMTRPNLMFPVAPTEIITSYGYNSNVTTAGAYRAPYLALTSFLRRMFPNTPLIAMGQAPMASTNTEAAHHLLRQEDIRALAGAEGYGFIDVTQRFLDLGSYDSYINSGDLVHPTAAGSQIWLAEIQQFFGIGSQRALPTATPPLAVFRPLAAKIFDALSGSPTYAVTNSHPAWAMPNGADSAIIASMVDIPADWALINVYVVWFTSATTGTVTFTPRYGWLSTLYGNQSGASSAPGGLGSFTITASSTTNTMRFSSVASAYRPSGYPLEISLTRNGSTDTCAAAAQVVGILVERAG